MLHSIKKQAGFTLVELLVVLTVFGILTLAVFTIFINQFISITRSDSEARLTVESQLLVRDVVERLRDGYGSISLSQSEVSGSGVTDPYKPAAGWVTSNALLRIIVNTPAQDSANNFIIDDLTGDPYLDEQIYFADATNRILYRRTLKNTNASGSTTVQTCPKPNASPSCPADAVLTEHFQSMIFTLYDQDNTVTLVPELARSVLIEVTLNRGASGNDDVEITNKIRITLRNKKA